MPSKVSSEWAPVPAPYAPVPWPDTRTNPAYGEAVKGVAEHGELTEGRIASELEVEFLEWLNRGPVPATLPGSGCVAVSTGTDAIEVALRALQLPPRSKVVVPALTFSGTVLPVVRAGHVPVFADVERATFNVSPETVQDVAHGVEAIVPVHLHGLPAPVDQLTEYPGIAFNHFVVEDCAQAYGALIGGRHVGTFGEAAAWSLNRTKTLFAGEGGLVTTKAHWLWRNARSLRRYGETHSGDDHDDVSALLGSNFKLPELSAAIARVSLTELDSRIEMAWHAAGVLIDACHASGVLIPPYVPHGMTHAYHKFRVTVPEEVSAARVFRALREEGVPVCRWQTRILPHHPAFAAYAGRGRFPNARWILEHTFIIGSEARPLASVSPLVAEEWGEKISNLKEYL